MSDYPGTRLMRASEDLLELFGTRTNDGRALSAVWGEPYADGTYEPTFTATDDGMRLVTTAQAEFAQAWERVLAALPEGWAPSLAQTALPGDGRWLAIAVEYTIADGRSSAEYGPTPTAALTALAEALEARP